MKPNHEMSLKDLLCDMWTAKFFIVIGVILGLVITFFYVSSVTPKYKAMMIVAAADGYALGDYASTIQYDRIATLPFWRPKDQEGASTDFYRFIHTLRGTSAAIILMQDSSFVNGVNKNLKNKIKTPEALSLYLSRYLRVDPLGATPLRKLAYHHADPDFAVALLRKVHLVADQMIRRDRRRQSQSRIEYLNNSLGQTVNPDHRKGIANLLMQQEHIQMLANLDEAYAAIVVEPASHSPKTVWPNKPLMYFIGGALGFFLGFLMWSFFKKEECEID